MIIKKLIKTGHRKNGWSLALCLGGGFFLAALVGLGSTLVLVQAVALSQAQQEKPKPSKAVLADKISMAVRGLPAGSKERTEFEQGKSNIAELAESYLKDEAFIDRLSRFWLAELKIFGKVSLEETEVNLGGGAEAKSISDLILENNSDPDLSRIIFLNHPEGPNCQPRLQMLPGAINPASETELQKQVSLCNSLPEGNEKSEACSRASQFENRLMRRNAFNAVHHCPCGTEIKVRPYWAPDIDFLACPSLLEAKLLQPAKLNLPQGSKIQTCGSKLENCTVYDPILTPDVQNFPAHLLKDLNPVPVNGSSPISAAISGFTREPGRLIAQLVADREDFRKILTDSRTVMNGAMEAFYQSAFGKALLKQLPDRTFIVNGKNQLEASAANREGFRWVDRGASHAGVLTTWAFQQHTNGYRAKANRVYETFMCKRFVIPAGVVESNTDSNDVLVRQPCASCHALLEPMGAFFDRWHRDGTNYIYDVSQKATGRLFDAQGSKEGTDVRGLAELVANDERFFECSVQRAFEFVMGRSFSDGEAARLKPDLVADFREHFDFFKIVTLILSSESFSGGGE